MAPETYLQKRPRLHRRVRKARGVPWGLCAARTRIGTVSLNLAVSSLKALQKFIRLSPRWPSAEPTGGCGVAFPALRIMLKREVTLTPAAAAMAHELAPAGVEGAEHPAR